MDDKILVSIVTVSYNSEKTIRRTIESVLEQTYQHMEYIIIDGESTDNTVSIAEEYAVRFQEKGIKYSIISEPDYGIYDAMNKGISKASGELIGIINSDDWYEIQTVATIVQKYKETHYDLIFGDLYMVKPDGYSFIKKAKKSRYVTSRHWNHPTQFVHRKIYEKFMYRCENISDDMDFYFRVIKEGYHIEVVNEVLANFQIGGVSSRIAAKEIVPRVLRRFRIYQRYGFSKLYILECIAFEVVKFLIIQ